MLYLSHALLLLTPASELPLLSSCQERRGENAKSVQNHLNTFYTSLTGLNQLNHLPVLVIREIQLSDCLSVINNHQLVLTNNVRTLALIAYT